MKSIRVLRPVQILLFAFIIFASCECYEEPGIVIDETRELTEFDGLIIETVGKINLYASEEFKINIKTHDNMMNDIVTTVSENILIVRLTGKHRRIKTLEIDVFAPYFTYIEQNDVADIYSQDGFTIDKLHIVQNDVGDIRLNRLQLESLKIDLNDVGDVELEGMTKDITASLKGVGEIHLFEMGCKHADLDLSGTGDIEINASETLAIDLSGVGSIYYKGTPTMSINHTGVGKIVNIN
jgi:hypothetical protein